MEEEYSKFLLKCNSNKPVLVLLPLLRKLLSFETVVVDSAQVLRLLLFRQVVVILHGKIVLTRNITKCTAFGKNINRFWFIRQVLQSAFLLKLTWLALWMFDLPHHKSPISYQFFEAMLISVIPVELIYHFLSIIQKRAFVFICLFLFIYPWDRLKINAAWTVVKLSFLLSD